MHESIALRIQRSEVRLLQETLEEPWQSEHRQAMRASDWEFILGKCLQLPADMERGWQITCREAVTDDLDNREERSREIETLFDLTIELVCNVQTRVQEFVRATGHTVEGLAELEEALRKLRTLKEKYLFRLSLIDHQVIEEARAEHAAGDYPTAGAALADLLAARHAGRMTPSYAELRRWADQSPPEPAWFEEEEPPQ